MATAQAATLIISHSGKRVISLSFEGSASEGMLEALPALIRGVGKEPEECRVSICRQHLVELSDNHQESS